MGLNDAPFSSPQARRFEQARPLTCLVVKVDTEGIWTVPIGEDLLAPEGPHHGASTIKKGDIVLVVPTQERAWALKP